jgi:hypothetical protein
MAKGIGGIALNLFAEDGFGMLRQEESFGGLPSLPHFAPKAKRCIYLHMMGAPPQMDLLDYKPQMKDWYDKDLPESVRQGQRLTTMTSGQSRFPIAPSVFQFAQYGKSGAWVSSSCPTPRRWSTTSPSSARCNRGDQSRAGSPSSRPERSRPSVSAWIAYGSGA